MRFMLHKMEEQGRLRMVMVFHSGGKHLLTCSQENASRDKGHPRMVPNLREIHVLRDSWTKLNAFPAKIMQVSLYHYFVHMYNNFFVTASSYRTELLCDTVPST